MQVTLLPIEYINYIDNDGNIFVQKRPEAKMKKYPPSKVLEIIKNDLEKHGLSSKSKVNKLFALPNTRKDFEAFFIDQYDIDNPKVKNLDLFARRSMGLVSYYRSAGEKYFPTVLPRIIESVNMCDTQFSTYVEARDKERKMESSSKRAGRGVLGAKSTVYRAFSRMSCNFVFPSEINRVFPNDIRSAMKREIEIIDENEEKEADDLELESDETKVKKANAKAKKEVDKRYEEHMENIMKKLDQNGDKYLALDQLQNNYSSKLAKIYEHIESSLGKILLYSQFRSIEGIGVTSLMLKHHGYVEVKLEHSTKTKDWSIVNAEEVLDPKYNGKRYVVFDVDRHKTKILLQLYNAFLQEDSLPQGIVEQLKPLFEDTSSTDSLKKNLRGEFIKLLMITQSGAEGISLKNVRRVLIMEPFWNMVRMDQIVGRAVRTGSHEELPLAERIVEVYIYTAVFTDKQLRDNFTLRRLDNSVTSDTHIIQIAKKKDALNQIFISSLKSTSIDCRNNAGANQPLKQIPPFSCYSFPIPSKPNSYSYTPSLEFDSIKSLESRLVKNNKVRGKVVTFADDLDQNKQKYVQIDKYPTSLFDYNAYKNAGVLVEVKK